MMKDSMGMVQKNCNGMGMSGNKDGHGNDEHDDENDGSAIEHDEHADEQVTRTSL